MGIIKAVLQPGGWAVGRVITLGFIAVYFVASQCFACDPGQETKVKVTLVVILASKNPPFINPKLTEIARQVRKKLPHLKRFEMESISCEEVPLNTTKTFTIIEDQKVRIHVTQNGKNHIRVKVCPPAQKPFVYRTDCLKFLPVVTRYRTAKKERLILAIRTLCPEENKDN